MSKKIGTFGAFLSDVELSGDNIATLETAAGLQFAPQQRTAIASIISGYADNRRLWDLTPKPREVIDILVAVELAAKALNDSLNALGRSPAGQAAASELEARILPTARVTIAGTQRHLAFIRQAANHAVAKLPKPQRGAPGDPHRNRFVRELYRVFQEAGGGTKISINAGATGGAFFEFAMAASKLAGFPAPPDGMRATITALRMQKNSPAKDDLIE